MTDSELLNCPFCGASAEVTNRLNLKWARCSYFDCFMHSHEVMPEMWNRRSAPPGEGQWVPQEPTEVMFDAVWSNFGATDFEGLHKKLSIHELRQLYKMFYSRMLAAAPSHHSVAVVPTRKQIARAIQFLDLADAFNQRTPYGTASEMLNHIFDKAREFTEDGETLRHPSSTASSGDATKAWLSVKESASPPSASAQGWQEDVRLVLEAFDKGVFVRNIDNDSKPGWALSLLPYLGALGRLQDAATTQEKVP